MSKITYATKSALNVNSSIADVNKCNAADLNEIKTVVNANDDNVGDLADLETEDVSSIVNAVNEVNTNANAKQSAIQSGTSLPSTVTNGAIFLLYTA